MAERNVDEPGAWTARNALVCFLGHKNPPARNRAQRLHTTAVENKIHWRFEGVLLMGEVWVNSRGAFRSGKDFWVVISCGFGSMVRPRNPSGNPGLSTGGSGDVIRVVVCPFYRLRPGWLGPSEESGPSS